MTSKEFIQMFCGDASVDKKFCFILGSGASKSSGINTGAELAEKWLAEIPTFVDKPVFELWCEEEKIDKNDPGPHYSKIFEKRYNDRKDGDAFLDGVMQKAWPSYGYFVLAKILSEMRHNIVITPNFDSLCEDALFFYTQKKPLVIGHQSLGNYINVSPSRPTIIKVHNDVLLSPKNSRIDLQRISQEYEMKLKDIFKLYIPVVIGYGGNDESLMSFLENISHIESQMYWCYLDSDKVGVRVNNLICKNTKIETVPIQGFDQLMIQIANRFQHNRIDNDLFRIAQKWVKLSRDQIIKIVQDKPDDINTKKALFGINKRGDEDLFYYLLNGSVVTDIQEKDNIYREGIKKYPKSSEIYASYAIFLQQISDSKNAEKNFKISLRLDSENANNLGHYAIFLHKVKNDYKKAEEYYEKSLRLDSQNLKIEQHYSLLLNKNSNYCSEDIMNTTIVNQMNAEPDYQTLLSPNTQEEKSIDNRFLNI